jgi:hypothetical protein
MKNVMNLIACFTVLALVTFSCQENEEPLQELGLAFTDNSGMIIPISNANFSSAIKSPFTVIVSNPWSAIEQRTIRIVKNEDEMAKLWAEIHTNQSPQPSMPSINFNSEMAIFVFSGARSTTGYSLNLEQVWEEDGKVVFGIKETVPSPNSVTGTAMTNPYIGISMIKSDKPLQVKFLN